MIFFLLTLSRASQLCDQIIVELGVLAIMDEPLLFKQLFPYMYLSGKGYFLFLKKLFLIRINSYGMYDYCLKNYTYANVQGFVPFAPVSGNIGVCITDKCTIHQLNQEIQILKAIMIKYFDKYIGFDLTNYDMLLVDPRENPPELNSITIIFILFVAFIIIIQLIVTIKNSGLKQNHQIENITNLSTHQELEEEQEAPILKFLDIKYNYTQITPSQSKFEILNAYRLMGCVMCLFGDMSITMLIQSDFISVQHFIKSYQLQVVLCCLYSVEIFLFLSGFFAVQTMNKQNVLKSLLLRLYKIWPILGIVLIINSQILPHLGGGPRWFYVKEYTKTQYWWQQMLFISNFYDDNYNVMWLYYLSLDMQMYLMACIIMFIYKRNKFIGKLIVFELLTISQIYILYICFTRKYGLPYYALQNTDIYMDFNYRPWFRVPPFLIGMIMSFLHLEKQLILKGWVQALCIITGILIVTYLTFGWYDTMQFGQDYYPEWFQYTYEGTMRTIYAIALSLVALPNLMGYSNFLYKMVNFFIVRHIVKFTFAAYMIQYIVVGYVLCSFYESPELSVFSVVSFFIICAFLLSIFTFIFQLLFIQPLQYFVKSSKNKIQLNNLIDKNDLQI